MRALIIIIALAAAPAFGQAVMDGTDESLGDGARAALRMAADHFVDPYGTQFRDLSQSSTDPAIVCGQVNAKNRAGGYMGFEPFYLNTESGKFFANRYSGLLSRTYTTELGCPLSIHD